MANEKGNITPRNFYLNEQHELARGEKEGGGGVPKLGPIDWEHKGKRIKKTLDAAKAKVNNSRDPLREQRYFLLALPLKEVPKRSDNKKKAPEGKYLEVTSYSQEHSRVFRKLGMDLIQVNDDGTATVHVAPERIEQLSLTAENLAKVGITEQSRWATIDSFETIPPKLRIDKEWLDALDRHKLADSVIELQPLLKTVEADVVMRSIAALLKRDQSEALTGSGSDFSGRFWLRARLMPQSLNAIAQNFYSIQSLHSPLIAFAAAAPPKRLSSQSLSVQSTPPDLRSLPCVAILDTGVPTDHISLSPYRRGQFIDINAGAGRQVGDHGSWVASRVVFGDIDSQDGRPPLVPAGRCSFYDVMVANGPDAIEEKSVLSAMAGVLGNAPDVRVFNLSFDNRRALDLEPEVKRREKLILVQDLDNFIFANDVVVVVAAGNSPPGLVPNNPYPDHVDEDEWKLGTWSRCFNAITCGSFVANVTATGLISEPGAPSPFTRVGPGLADSPKPDFSAPGGNGNNTYNFAPGLGVWVCNAVGQWEDHAGTSYAAPILAREAALTLRELDRVCEPGTKPYGVTAKAYLALTATAPVVSARLRTLAARTLGKGTASVRHLLRPAADKAVFVWQGMIENPDDIVRVQMPIPGSWLQNAEEPSLRLVLCWDTPVNAAAHNIWSSRKVNVQLRAAPDAEAQHSSRHGHPSYPLVDRMYNLAKVPTGVTPEEMWLLEISYENIADYFPVIDFSPLQRVAFAAELVDLGRNPVSPQLFLQGLPLASTMHRLSVTPVSVRNLIAIKSRV